MGRSRGLHRHAHAKSTVPVRVQTDLMVDTFGNILSIAGVLITLVAYRRIRFHELEPRLAALWQRILTVLRRLPGWPQPEGKFGSASGAWGVKMGIPSVRVWSPIDANDAIEVMVEKVARNLDNLVREFDDFGQKIETKIAEVQSEATERLTRIESDLAARDEDERAADAFAARWEVRGLMMVLVGTVMSSIW